MSQLDQIHNFVGFIASNNASSLDAVVFKNILEVFLLRNLPRNFVDSISFNFFHTFVFRTDRLSGPPLNSRFVPGNLIVYWEVAFFADVLRVYKSLGHIQIISDGPVILRFLRQFFSNPEV